MHCLKLLIGTISSNIIIVCVYVYIDLLWATLHRPHQKLQLTNRMTVKTIGPTIKWHMTEAQEKLYKRVFFRRIDGNDRGYPFATILCIQCVPRSTILVDHNIGMVYVYRERLTKRYFWLAGIKRKRRLPTTVYFHFFNESTIPIHNDSFETDHWKQLYYIEYSRNDNRKIFSFTPVRQNPRKTLSTAFFPPPDVSPNKSLAQSAVVQCDNITSAKRVYRIQ